MRILITGICGFVGSTLAKALLEHRSDLEMFGIDNFIRPGSETNRAELKALGIKILHGDIRSASDLEAIPPIAAVIDAAANPSVLAGVDGSSSRDLVDQNLHGTVNLLELCKKWNAGFTLLSTSRVYSIAAMASLPMAKSASRFEMPSTASGPGWSHSGITEDFSTQPPISLYGSTKLCSEWLALEYGEAFGFPVWINRCGVLAGAGQFGKADQGIFSYWIHSWIAGRPLRYIGFGGSGLQVRDCLHPRDLATILLRQIDHRGHDKPRIVSFSGGLPNSMSLKELSTWCTLKSGPAAPNNDPARLSDSGSVRPFDIPWAILDSSLAEKTWGWKPEATLEMILCEIQEHAMENPAWLDLVAG